MINKLISGVLIQDILNLVFNILKALFTAIYTIILVLLKIIKKILTKLIAKKLDKQLAKIGKHLVVRTTNIEPNTITFITAQGEYTCNPKYIAEEILRRKLPYKISWIVRSGALGPYPPEFKLVKDRTPGYYREIAKSKIVIQNAHTLQKNYTQKNEDQYWLQTWHGSLGLKKLEGAGGDEKFYNKMVKLDNEQTDYIISNSQFEDNVFSGSYWSSVPSLRLGHARNDILFNTDSDTHKYLRKKVLKRLGVEDTGQKFLLYAPTHDDSNPYQAFGNLNLEDLRKLLGDKFGGSWEILIRTHNNNKKKSDTWLSGMPTYCHNASFYPDMQELLLLADAGLTDYSSWICDFILTRKPSFLFGLNIEKYEKTRGFYHKFEDTPFSIATNNAELLNNISEFNQNVYESKIDTFLEACESIDDGNASKRIVDEIEKLMSS